MDLTLTTDEISLLRRILENYLSDLRMEIVDTEKYELRQEMKHDDATIKSLLKRLERTSVGVL